MAGGAAVTLLVISVLLAAAAAELPLIHHPAKADGSISVLVVGDWGRKGTFNQSTVAHQMGRIGEKLNVDFVISTGDNFYDNGLTGVDDRAFEKSFVEIYTAPSLQKPWYSEIAHFFFVDTTPFVESYWTDPNGIPHDSRGVSPRDQYISNTLKDLESGLRASPATWKFVIGHHAIRSVSIHGDTPELVKLLLPVLKANDVDLYINGHDHCLEHISSKDSPIQFMTSGAGSKAWRGVYTPNADKLRFFYDGQGFMAMELSRERLEVSFYDIAGNVLHRWTTTKDLHPYI